MSAPELGSEARAVVHEGRLALQATASDKQRVYAALQAKLALGGGTSDVQPAAATALGNAVLGNTVVGAIVVVIVVGAAMWFARHSSGSTVDDATAPPRTSVEMEVFHSIGGALAEPVVEPSSTGSMVPKTVGRPSAVPSNDRLAEEAALLVRAEKEYHAGNMSKALLIVDEHARKFPKGVLRQERVTLKGHVLCGLGNDSKSCAKAP